MKTRAVATPHDAAAIVRLSDSDLAPPATSDAPGTEDHGTAALLRARAFAEPLLSGQRLDTGEEALSHADGVAAIL